MPDDVTQLRLAEPPPVQPLLPEPIPWIAPTAALLLALLLALLWSVLRKHRSKPDPAAARKAAYRQARAALESIRDADPREAATRCSLALRHYLSGAGGDPALFETHEEFSSRTDALAKLAPAARQEARDQLARLVQWKYRPAAAHADAGQVVADASRLLETLHHGPQP
jgi:hypothetical protein